ncbi:MAG: fumarate hydratase [Dethiobacteria bacterium]|nr:fumarate hydratase [Bacillota bacterium]
MREIAASTISEQVAEMCQEANIYLGEDVFDALKKSLETEESPTGKEVLKQLIENVEIARDEQIPICQDTGFAVFFVEWGQEVHLTGGTLEEAIHAGVRKGYEEGYLRKSIVDDPLYKRKNTGDNTPAVIYTDIVPGDKVKIAFAPKGGGSENMSTVKMLKPSDGEEGVVDFVVSHVKAAGPNPCPPIVVGVGIGGTFDKVAVNAKKALFRKVGEPHPDEAFAALEKKILDKINDLGVGPQGFGGRTFALAVHIETFPSHIASMAAAVNINCHACRHLERTI